MNKEFFTIKLSEIADVIAGQSPESIYYSNSNGVPFLQGNRTFGNLYPTIDTYTSKVTKLAKKGDVLMSVRAPVGDLNYAPLDLCIGRGLASIRSKFGSNEFIYYALKYNIRTLSKQGTGTTFDSVNKDVINDFELIIPETIQDRESITKILSTIDNKIELNNRINAELESMAKTLYDYWFVQFDFPNEKGKPYKSSGGKMVWNEELKREVPEGWGVVELKDIANITMGQSPPGDSYNENQIGMIFYQGCTDFGNRFPTIRKYTTKPTRYSKKGDILLSVRAPVGTLNISKEDCCIGRGLASLNSKDNCISYLHGVMVNLKQVFDRRNVNGTTFGSITKDDLFSLKVVKPHENDLNRFNEIINPCFEKQNTIELENIQLAELRDWLLPMLMNGQVKVN